MGCEPRQESLIKPSPRRSAMSGARAGCKFVSSTLLASTVLSRAARIAIPVIVLSGVSGVAFAQDATWVGATSDWNTPGNWSPNVVPTGTATFNASTPTSITTSAASTIQTLSFNAPGYTLTPATFSDFSITGSGIQATPTNAPTLDRGGGAGVFFANSSTAGPSFINAFNTGAISFQNTSTAGSATITAGLAGQNLSTDPGGFTGGFVLFRDSSTAADAKITTFWASNIEFQDTSKAGNANNHRPQEWRVHFFRECELC